MDTARRPAQARELPRSLYLETTNRCDSKCQTCIRTFAALEPPKDLTLVELTRIVEQFPGLERVVLHGIGEPLLNRELWAMIAYLKGRGVTVLFNSDAISLTPKRASQLIDSGLDEFRVSIDAARPDTYRRLRGVDQFERVTSNVRRLVELQGELARPVPRVSIWFTASTINIDELPDFVRLAARLGVGEVYVQRLVFNGLGLATEANSLHGSLRAREQRALEDSDALARAHSIAFKASGLTTPLDSLSGLPHAARPWAGCQRPWTLSYVTANGNVLPCCISPWVTTNYANLVLGNAFSQPFAAIWNGERYQRFRTEFESDTAPDPCRSCGLRWSI